VPLEEHVEIKDWSGSCTFMRWIFNVVYEYGIHAVSYVLPGLHVPFHPQGFHSNITVGQAVGMPTRFTNSSRDLHLPKQVEYHKNKLHL